MNEEGNNGSECGKFQKRNENNVVEWSLGKTLEEKVRLRYDHLFFHLRSHDGRDLCGSTSFPPRIDLFFCITFKFLTVATTHSEVNTLFTLENIDQDFNIFFWSFIFPPPFAKLFILYYCSMTPRKVARIICLHHLSFLAILGTSFFFLLYFCSF